MHGLDEAMGLNRSILGYIVGAGALGGAALGLLLQWFASSYAYPIVISEIIGDIKEGDEIVAYANNVPVGATRLYDVDYPFVISTWQAINDYGVSLPGFNLGDEIDLRLYSISEDTSPKTKCLT